MLAATGISELDDVTAEVNDSIDTGVKPLDESYGPGNVHSRKLGALDPRRGVRRSDDAAGAPARQSIEARAFAFFGPEGQSITARPDAASPP